MKFLLGLILIGACQNDFQVVSPQENHITLVDEEIYVYEEDTRVETDLLIEPDPVTSLDILVVIDKSCSMADNNNRVGSGMAELATQISSVTLDYQFGFITTDPNCATDEFAGPYDSTSSSIDLEMAPNILSSRCGFESGFLSTYLYLNDPNQFTRLYSDLLIFLVSDEEEQSTISAGSFQEWILSYKDSQNSEARTDVVSITTLDQSSCSYTYGLKYVELMTLMNKNSVDLCSENWESWLGESSFLTSLQNEIPLSYIPDPLSIRVEDKDENLLEVLIDYSYDEPLNTIYILSPEFSQTYIVSYETREPYIP